jgi:hypothetical protein
MKPKNFPVRKLLRQLTAQGVMATPEQVDLTRQIRTKKKRG